MAFFEWRTYEAQKYTGKSKPVLDSAGQPILTNGKPKMRRINETVKYEAPFIAPLSVHDSSELSDIFAQIVAAQKPNFLTLAAVVEHMIYGFQKSIASALNQGHDARFTPVERKMISSFRTLVKATPDLASSFVPILCSKIANLGESEALDLLTAHEDHEDTD